VSRPLRFTFILALTTAATVLAAAGGWRYARASAPVSGPIILISIDTLRADRLSAYGYRAIQTPGIDLLAADGVVFERAYAHVPLTRPSHTTLLTGRLPDDTGVHGERDTLNPDRGKGAPGTSDIRMLAQMLRDRGYATAAVVSTTLLGADSGLAQGFSTYDDDIAAAPLPRIGVERVRDGAQSEAIAERWLDASGRSRSFLFLQLNEPHAPYAAYDAAVASADEIVGRLIRFLKTHQLYDRSTIILLSDHGEGLGDHGESQHGLLLDEAALHVPLIVKQEGNADAGRRVKDIVQLIDVAPTVLDLVKAPYVAGLHGRSLRPLLEGAGSLPPATVPAESLYAKDRFGWSALAGAIDEHGIAVRVDAEPGLPSVDPRGKVGLVETVRRADSRAANRRWTESLALMEQAVRAEPETPALWTDLASYASIVGRHEVALDAYRHVIDLAPSDARGYLDAAATLLKQQKLREAAEQAAIAVDLASDGIAAADGHELVARIAAARRDADAARREAALSQQADPRRPVAAFIDGRLLYDQGRYADAVAPFETALAAARESHATIADLHYLAGDTYARVDRPRDAETQFEAEIEAVPWSVRARAGLAALYRSSDRGEEADRAIEAMTRAVPTPESYQLAAKLLTQSGNRRQADVVRAEARRVFAK
jgi:tetratricopeptide (TPR) repeat protein